MFLNRLTAGKQRGDTIVEVMVVLAVLGLSISISYATAARSLSDTRQAQESTEASILAKSQLEALRTLANNPTIFTNGPGQPFCVDTSSTPFQPVLVSTGNCINGLYAISIVGPGNAQGGLFTVTISWPDLESSGNDTNTLEYRFYP